MCSLALALWLIDHENTKVLEFAEAMAWLAGADIVPSVLFDVADADTLIGLLAELETTMLTVPLSPAKTVPVQVAVVAVVVHVRLSVADAEVMLSGSAVVTVTEPVKTTSAYATAARDSREPMSNITASCLLNLIFIFQFHLLLIRRG
jgi:hypothetical protein